jgi:hypothetical protein
VVLPTRPLSLYVVAFAAVCTISRYVMLSVERSML